MECQGCGHNYPNTLSCCPKCKRLSPKRGQRFADSRLIEFPRRTRNQPKAEQTETRLPAWRAELNEKVRAIKARRDGQAPETQSSSPNSTQISLAETRDDIPPARHSEPRASSRIAAAREARASLQEPQRAFVTQPLVSREPEPDARAERKPNSHIVEAALTRVRRASENASRASLPKIEPARPARSTLRNSFSVDREATARQLETVTEAKASPVFAPPPAIEPVTRERFEPEALDDVATERLAVETKTIAQETDYQAMAVADDSIEMSEPSHIVPDEIEPVDYLEAEVRKVTASLERESGLPLSTHFAIYFIDLVTIAFSASPFIALIIITNGSFQAAQTRFASAAAFGLVGFFYLALTQWLAGKTFGMMMTNTRVVDAETMEPVSPSCALKRTAGYFVAAAPALIGFLWIAFSHNRRGWHDYISGTMVAGDY